MRIALTLLTLALLTALSSLTPPPPTVDDSPLAELAWLEGTWRIELEGQTIEETYAAPLGNSITGSFRWLRGGDAWIYEFLLIEEVGDEVTYYLRHFSPGSVSHEPKDAPMAYALVELTEDEVVFENLELSPQRMIYTRDGDDRLNVVLEKEKDGATARDTFPFERVRG